jgi:hypothetical protein
MVENDPLPKSTMRQASRAAPGGGREVRGSRTAWLRSMKRRGKVGLSSGATAPGKNAGAARMGQVNTGAARPVTSEAALDVSGLRTRSERPHGTARARTGRRDARRAARPPPPLAPAAAQSGRGIRDHLVVRAVASDHKRIPPFARTADIDAIRCRLLATLPGVENSAQGSPPLLAKSLESGVECAVKFPNARCGFDAREGRCMAAQHSRLAPDPLGLRDGCNSPARHGCAVEISDFGRKPRRGDPRRGVVVSGRAAPTGRCAWRPRRWCVRA